MINSLKVLIHQGKRYIKDVTCVEVPGIFRGRPVISLAKVNEEKLSDICPTGAITINPVCIDLGKCVFCGECAFAFPEKIKFTKDYKLATNNRNNLLIYEGRDEPVKFDKSIVRPEIKGIFKDSLTLRQVSAGGDNSCELELNSSNNVNFDISRFGIEFTASPRHADGIVITGPITRNMAKPLELTCEAVPDPKVIILAGTDAISGGIFKDSPAIDRSFIDNNFIDLYIPGNPVHPLAFINGLLELRMTK